MLVTLSSTNQFLCMFYVQSITSVRPRVHDVMCTHVGSKLVCVHMWGPGLYVYTCGVQACMCTRVGSWLVCVHM